NVNPLPISILEGPSKSYKAPEPSDSNGISRLDDDAEIQNLIRFVTYSAASYCQNSFNWSCGQYCNNISQTTVVKTFTTHPAEWVKILGENSDAYAILTINNKYQEIVLTFRGTDNFGNAVKDLE
ncbi:27640_t:CDS:2, partial [Racocetra persica]